MKKTKIIREIVGKRLEPYGFQYYKTESALCIFMREMHGIQRFYEPEKDVVKQYITIQDSGFSKMLTVNLYTDAHVEGKKERMEQLKELDLQGTSKWVEYEDEESYRKALNRLTEIIIKYGFNELEQMSRENPVIVTKDMEEKLYMQYKELDALFIEEYHIKMIPEKEEDIDEWYRIIRKIIMEYAEYPYEEVKEILIKIAAFHGERLCELLEAEWKSSSDKKIPIIFMHQPCPAAFSPLGKVLGLWKYKCDKEHWSLIDYDIRAMKEAVKIKKTRD